MKAIVLIKDGNPSEAFQFRDLPTPKCGANQVLIKVSHFRIELCRHHGAQRTL